MQGRSTKTLVIVGDVDAPWCGPSGEVADADFVVRVDPRLGAARVVKDRDAATPYDAVVLRMGRQLHVA